MVVTQKSFILNTFPSSLFVTKIASKFGKIQSIKKKDLSQNSKIQQKPNFPFTISSTILARSVVVVLGLGFIDAGYSGDWSRIGVISKEAEDLLKIAAFLVVPLCIFLVFSISQESET